MQRNVTRDEVAKYITSLNPERGLWIDNEGLPGSNGTLPIYDPSTGQVIAQMANASALDATKAVDSAQRAFEQWRHTTPRERSIVLRRAFDLMIERKHELAGLMSLENGKALADGYAEVAYGAEFFRWFSEEAVRNDGEYNIAPASGTRTIVTSQPVGVAALITPWNFPAAMATRKIGPAVAAGCAVVLKPAQETPLTALAVAQILAEAGLPAGVVNVVTSTSSRDISGPWLEDERVRMISLTGSTPVGVMLMRQAAERIVTSAMELGGNNPLIIGPGADIDQAVQGAMLAKFRNGGQACTAANRIYVHESVADAFLEAYGARVAALKVGDPFGEGMDIGPVVNAKAKETLTGLLERAIAEGAQVVAQAAIPEGDAGLFVPPTVLRVEGSDLEIMRTEIFGPLSPVTTWNDEEQLVKDANDTDFGLTAYVFDRDLQWCLKLAERLEAGMVGINRGLVSDPAAPFGGMKQSGIGREGGKVGIDEFQETQYFSVAW
ncbi:MAG: NAD-dependent succinate-semialdehyde dehydrogenase [Actinomycetaceae bacterium]|nr:NAD-dependent succinate-semialdehyde dehydrogenase [Actinomycetaceae bacterium]